MSTPTREDVLAAARAKAAARFERGDWASSERDYELLTHLDSEHADNWARLGFIRVELGSVAEGARCLQKARDLDPAHSAAKLHFGEALVRLGRISDGLTIVKEVWDDEGVETTVGLRARAVLATARIAAIAAKEEKSRATA